MIDGGMRRASGAQLVYSQLREPLRMLLAEDLVEQMRLLVDHPAELTVDP